ncbi:MAG: xylulokinase [Deltaproteobacteria bacterium]|nr:xylulokinase [Candidatus Zymogenaceae bacterium]
MARQAFLGIDIGTSTTKAVLVSEKGLVLGSCVKDYDIQAPTPGAAEQDPDAWWRAVVSAAGAVRRAAGKDCEITAVGLTGQMHSAVFISEAGRALRPAILWADKRATGQADLISERLGDRGLWRVVRNPIPVGFTAPSILWVKENEPEIYERTVKVLQPKDYVVMRLTGAIGTDVTDASATGLLDIGRRSWSDEVLDALEIPPDILPEIHRPGGTAGTPAGDAASELSLTPSVPVVYGGGDQPVQAVGNGIIRPGAASLTIGTGGQVLLPVGSLGDTGNNRPFKIHTFCHCVEGLFYHMGATLAAGLSLKWFRDTLAGGQSFDRLDRAADRIAPGSDGLIFLPHLMGERTPHMNPGARGLFYGIDLSHSGGHFARAVMEGVAFSLREAAEAVGEVSEMPSELTLTGGGARSRVWSGIISNVLGVPVRFPVMDEGSAFGAALLAAVGSGAFRDVDEGVGAWVRYRDETIEPQDGIKEIYDGMYDRYRQIYQRLETDTR